MLELMTRAEYMWFERDHGEALGIERQLLAPVPELTGKLTSQDVIDLNRFWDTCEDGEGYDVPKDRMKRLRSLGLVEGGRFGRYQLTDLANTLHDYFWTVAAEKEVPGHG